MRDFDQPEARVYEAAHKIVLINPHRNNLVKIVKSKISVMFYEFFMLDMHDEYGVSVKISERILL